MMAGSGVALGLALASGLRLRPEHAPYRVALRFGELEVRDYAPQLVLETRVEGEAGPALREGFRRLTRYLFGDNEGGRALAELEPRARRRGGRFEMTVPVRQWREDGGWHVSLSLPARFTIDRLPRPTDPAVTLRRTPARRMAALGFKGSTGPERVEARTRELQHLLDRRIRRAVGPPVVARYDPPWRPVFLRRNEVLQEIEAPPAR